MLFFQNLITWVLFRPGTTTNVPVQRLTAQDILDKIQKHQQEQAKAQALAAAAAAKLPKYYNPTTVNAVKLAEQQQKRKLLWSKKDGENTSSVSNSLFWKIRFFFGVLTKS